MRYDWDNDNHPACPGGCGNLADECACRRPRPLGAIRVTPAYDPALDFDDFATPCRWGGGCVEDATTRGYCDDHYGTL